MPNVRSASEIANKWGRVTPERTQDYEDGIRSPKKDWKQSTVNAENTYEEGVKAAISRKAFGKGVTKAGTEKWQKGAIEKGIDRFGPGVQVAQTAYEEGVSPYLDVIEKTTLPPRYPKGDPRNIARVQAIAKALHDKKIKG